MQTAGNAAIAAGGLDTPAGEAAFQASLIARFNTNYTRAGSFWSAAPSNPTPSGLFSSGATYQRPATAYIALWQILGTDRFTKVLQTIQQTYGGGRGRPDQCGAAGEQGRWYRHSRRARAASRHLSRVAPARPALGRA